MLSSDYSTLSTISHANPQPSDSKREFYDHGNISEAQAEEMLNSGRPGLFLLRNASPQQHYISFVNTSSQVVHWPIRKINSSYFCHGQRFESIANAVDWFKETIANCSKWSSTTSLTDTKFSEKYLLSKTQKEVEENGLRGRRGNVISVLSRLNDGSIWGKNESNGSIGSIDFQLLQPIVTESNQIEDQPYFYNTMATECVKSVPTGSFLVRRSTYGADAYALCVMTQPNKFEKFLLVGSPKTGYYLADKPFKTIEEIFHFFCSKPIVENTRLTHAMFNDNGGYHGRRRPSAPVFNSVIPPQRLVQKRASLDILHFTLPLPDSTWSSKTPVSNSPDDVDMTEDVEDQQSMAPPSEMDQSSLMSNTTLHMTTSSSSTLTSARKLIGSTSALRKSKEDKPWKECWVELYDHVVLSEGTSTADRECSILTISESQTSTKNRATIDLSTFTMYWLDESVFATDGTIFLSHALAQHSSQFLCFRPSNVFLQWANWIRNRTLNRILPTSVADVNGNPHQLSMLYLDIEKFRSDQMKSDAVYSVSALLDGVKICSSPQHTVANNKNPTDVSVVVFDAKFVFPFLPSTSGTLQLMALTHSAHGKKGRPIYTSAVLPIPDCGDLELNNDFGFSLKAKRFDVSYLPPIRYAPLVALLREKPEELLSTAAGSLPKHQLRFLHTTLVYMYISQPELMMEMFRKIFDEELARSTAETLFRMDSLATGVVSQCLRSMLKTQLDNFLLTNQTFVNSLKQNNTESCAEQLMEFVSTTLQNTHLALQMLSILAECAKRRFGDEGHLVRRTISVLLVFRFINPTVLAAHSGSGQLAKLLQSAANTASSTVPLSELVSVSLITRNLFDKPSFYSCKKSIELPEIEDRSSEWMAVLCHLLSCCSTEGADQLPAEIRYLISYHKSTSD